MIKLFLTAWLQVGLVAMNVLFIASHKILPMLVTSFGISFTWSYNVKRVSFGNTFDRIIYALGATIGTLTGYLLSNYLNTYL